MKISRVSSGCILSVVLAFVIQTALAAAGATVVTTRNDDFSSPFTLTNPCNGEVVEGVVEGQTHTVEVFDSSGGDHAELFSFVHGTGVGDLGNTYVAHQTLSATGTATVNGVGVVTAVIDQPFISRGSADNLMVHLLAHYTITPNGTAVDFMVVSVECRG
jgi:hypothetical protein